MWIEKLAAGVLRVLTPIGPRYIRPSFLERVYLLWIFRHFESLPVLVLSTRQQRWIEALCSSQEFVSLPYSNGMEDAPILGTIERRPVVDVPAPPLAPARVAESAAGSPLVADGHQRS